MNTFHWKIFWIRSCELYCMEFRIVKKIIFNIVHKVLEFCRKLVPDMKNVFKWNWWFSLERNCKCRANEVSTKPCLPLRRALHAILTPRNTKNSENEGKYTKVGLKMINRLELRTLLINGFYRLAINLMKSYG